MIQIRPVTDLQNDFNGIEKEVLENKQTMYLTKNGYGSMVIMSLENFSKITDKSSFLNMQTDNEKKEHVEIISRPKKVIDEDDE